MFTKKLQDAYTGTTISQNDPAVKQIMNTATNLIVPTTQSKELSF
jgi:hypothetical protein